EAIPRGTASDRQYDGASPVTSSTSRRMGISSGARPSSQSRYALNPTPRDPNSASTAAAGRMPAMTVLPVSGAWGYCATTVYGQGRPGGAAQIFQAVSRAYLVAVGGRLAGLGAGGVGGPGGRARPGSGAPPISEADRCRKETRHQSTSSTAFSARIVR